MKNKRSFGKTTTYRILAVFLIALFFLGTYATLRANIRFSRLKYVEDTAKYAADITGENAEYLSENRLERAWKILRTSVKQPQTYEDYDLYASIAIAREDLEGAADYLQGCIDTCEGTASDLAVLHMRRGSLFILQEAGEQAMRELDIALEEDPYLAPAYYLRAQLYAQDDETEKALSDYRTYISLNGRDPEITASLAEVFEAAGEPENALICYDAGIERGTAAGPEKYAGRARCRITAGDTAGAEDDLEQYFMLTDEDPGGAAAAMLGMCRMESGDYKGAAEMFSRALENGYTDEALQYGQSQLC
ncbi:MAG: tetratricopeptide repeat protein, partial [Eubacterium sp.]|nr:tetratricopeptide repeat protein [Eubacterium sp.]